MIRRRAFRPLARPPDRRFKEFGANFAIARLLRNLSTFNKEPALSSDILVTLQNYVTRSRNCSRTNEQHLPLKTIAGRLRMQNLLIGNHNPERMIVRLVALAFTIKNQLVHYPLTVTEMMTVARKIPERDSPKILVRRRVSRHLEGRLTRRRAAFKHKGSRGQMAAAPPPFRRSE